MKEIVIPQKSGAFFKILFASGIPFAYLSYLLFQNQLGTKSLNQYVLVLIAIIALILLGIIINTLVQLSIKKPALVLNNKGLIDNVSMAKAGFISWKNISDCFIAKLSGVDQLMIKLKDYDSILENQNALKKGMLKVPIEDHGTPIAININLLAYSPTKLQKMIRQNMRG